MPLDGLDRGTARGCVCDAVILRAVGRDPSLSKQTRRERHGKWPPPGFCPGAAGADASARASSAALDSRGGKKRSPSACSNDAGAGCGAVAAIGKAGCGGGAVGGGDTADGAPAIVAVAAPVARRRSVLQAARGNRRRRSARRAAGSVA